MKETIKILKDDIIKRWKNAFDEISHLDNFEKQIVKRKYSLDSRFNLKDYSSGMLQPGGKLLNKIPDSEISFYEYGLNDNNQPVVSILTDRNGNIGWIGFYRYQKDSVEFIEFCIGTKVPSSLQRIQLKDGSFDIIQLLNVNGKGSYPIFLNMTKDQIIEKLLTEEHHLIIDIKKMIYQDDGTVEKADAFALVPGLDETEYELIYHYDENKELKKILSSNKKWRDQITYIKPSGKSIEELVKEVAIRLSNLTIGVLSEEKFDSPLFWVCLTYRDLDNYWPFASYVTANDVKSCINRGDDSIFYSGEFIDPQKSIQKSYAELDESFAELKQYIEKNEKWELGEEMLIQAARIMTENKLKGTIPVEEDFIVFALDTHSYDDLGNLLIKCGASKESVKKWTKLGWL